MAAMMGWDTGSASLMAQATAAPAAAAAQSLAT